MASRSLMGLGLHGLDDVYRLTGLWLDALGYGPEPAAYDWLATGTAARLRRYVEPGGAASRAALLVPAPIKTEDVWDLSPQASVVRRYLDAGFRVYLLAWPEVTPARAGLGLEDYAGEMLAACAETARADAGGAALHLAGHSLGGTLAALNCARWPEHYHTLTLLGSPLTFGAGTGELSRLAGSRGSTLSVLREEEPVPGSFLGLTALAAAPQAFISERSADLAAAIVDPALARLHWQAERWLMAERAMPARLFREIIDQLYRHDALMAGELTLAQRSLTPSDLRLPTAVVVSRDCPVVPPEAVLPALVHLPRAHRRVFWSEPEVGTAIQHLAPLIGPRAQREIWPALLDWLREQDNA